VLLLGQTRDELDGSAWAQVAYGHLGGLPPRVDLAAERAMATVMVVACRDGLVATAHDLSDGGLAQALVESCLRRDLGVRVQLDGDPFVQLFSESTARAMIALPVEHEEAFTDLCRDHGVPVRALGEVTEEASLVIDGVFDVPLIELRAAWSATLPTAMAH